ncbi:hypothetical protein HIM_06386 [Hirsutella minnesotensis 3608]|uniref:Uncharacterized protein n=1 Tax=Hirsutella minnesotensis 3608 TaxID=1043627 RepID=A0A0F7ZNQ4_9HYPO|nr:hypothetical protein HIM_06386 [Hirsutella minnesotensis 3608]
MTNQPSGSSLPQPRDAEPDHHSLFHREHYDSANHHESIHTHDHRHRHTYRRQRRIDTITDTDHPQSFSTSPSDSDSNPHFDASLGRPPTDHLKAPESFHSDESLLINAVNQAGSPPYQAVKRRNVVEVPSSLVVGPVLGNTVAISVPSLPATAAVIAPSLNPTTRATRPTRSSKYVIATRPAAAAVHTSSPLSASSASSANTVSSASSAPQDSTTSAGQTSSSKSAPSSISSIYPHLGDLHNGTTISAAGGNSSFVGSPSSKPLPLATHPTSLSSNSSGFGFSAQSAPSSPSLTASIDDDSFIATALSATATPSDDFTAASLTGSDSPFATSDSTVEVSATNINGGSVQTPAAFEPQPSITSSAQPSGDSGPLSEPQKRRIIGGVAGSVAGLAFLAVLILLVLKYKKRKSSDGLLGSGAKDSGPFRSLRGEESMSMTEKSRLSAVTALFSNMSRKKRAAQLTNSTGEEEARGFHRVAGRKLPPAIFTGGDGYSDPRDSIMSGASDYNRGSQAFDLTTDGQCQLALGAPMRPVSGVPIMRSGPARTPITENPFEDTPGTPTTPDMPMRPPGSRASASKLHESI